MSDLEGVMLSDYLLLQCINKGGIADVYRARQNGQGNYEVAVKIFRPGYAGHESFRDYFMTEAEKIGQFDHPNILPFLEFGEGEGLLYAVAPYVSTGTLDDLLKRVGGKFTAIQALPIIQQLCSAVQYAHDRDVIHGNIKPSNIFVATDGRILLSDFGIARSYDDSQQSVTRIGWGSAEYAAPEQSLGVLRKSSDIYTLGVLLFHILTGQPPFSGQTPVEVLLKHVRQQPPSARSFEPSISDAVDNVLSIALQKRSDSRYASADELSNAFLAAVTVAPIASPVAKTVPFATNPRTLQELPSRVDPHTPLPPTVAFTPPPVPSESESASKSHPYVLPEQTAVSPPPPLLSNPIEEVSDPDATEVRKKSAFTQQEGEGNHLFWSVEPVEWSPLWSDPGIIAGNSLSTPSSANEYLRSMPVVSEVPASSSAVKKPDAGGNETSGGPYHAGEPGSHSNPETRRSDTGNLPGTGSRPVATNNTSDSRLKKILPIVVVILLLLGLLAALLSSFLWPGPSPGSNTQQIASAISLKSGITVTPVSSPVHAGTAVKGKSGAPPVAATTVPTPVKPAPTPTAAPVPAFSCASGSIALDGSDNFQPTVMELTTDYNNQCSNSANFTVYEEGSKVGLDDVASGSINLAYSDLPSTRRPALVNYSVAAIIYVVVVNVDTQVTNLTTAQLRGIYTGQITNWSQVGGADEPVTIISHPENSTIRMIFEADVLKGIKQTVDGMPFGKYDSNDTVVQNVQGTSGGISYVPLSAVTTDLSQVQQITINGVNAAIDSVSSGSYPFWSVEHLYSKSAASGLALSFISFILTPSGATDLTDSGAVPIKNMSQAALNSHASDPTV